MENTGCWPVSCSNTLAALVNLSPDSPTQMLTHNLRMRSCLITFLVLSLVSFFATLDNGMIFFSGLGAALAGACLAADPPALSWPLPDGLPPFFGAFKFFLRK